MCFQRSSERIEGKSQLLQSGWKIFPQSRTGGRETPVRYGLGQCPLSCHYSPNFGPIVLHYCSVTGILKSVSQNVRSIFQFLNGPFPAAKYLPKMKMKDVTFNSWMSGGMTVSSEVYAHIEKSW